MTERAGRHELRDDAAAFDRSGGADAGELVATKSITPTSASSLDPRVTEIAWVAVRVTAARFRAISSDFHLSEALRAMSNVLEHTWDPGRTAAFTRIQSDRDPSGRGSLALTLALGVLGTPEDAASDAERCASVALAALSRYPSPFSIERIAPAALLDNWPKYLATIRQPWVEVANDTDTARVPSRFDRELESWLELAELFVGYPNPLMLHASFMATSISPVEALWLEREATRAAAILERAREDGNAVTSRRAARVIETLSDVSESFSGPLWVGEVVVGSDQPLPRPLVRSIAASISNQCDVLHAADGAPVVAARRRIVGGFEIESERDALEKLALGLPRPALRARVLTDCFSITEAALCFRWPVPAGRAIPTILSDGHTAIPAPAGLPTSGVRFGSDSAGRQLFLGEDAFASHGLWLGGTGSGKSTGMRAIIRNLLERGEVFALLDPHGDLASGVRADAAHVGREIALVDADEPGTLSLDLVGGIKPGSASADDIARAADRIVGAVASHLNPDFAGPVFQAMSRAAFTVVFGASDRYILGLGDLARAFIDQDLLRWLLSETDDSHAAKTLQRFLSERDSAEAAIWAGSKFDAFSTPGAERIFAPFGQGVSVGATLSAGTPLVINLGAGSLSRLASYLLGHIVLATTVDYALTRQPDDRTPFTVWVDEAQRFPAVNLIDALAETRKYGMRMVVATQELSRLDYELRDALVSNSGMRTIFRVGLADAALLAPVIGVPAAELASLPNLNACVHVTGHAPFSVKLEPPDPLSALPPYAAPRTLVDGLSTKRTVTEARGKKSGKQQPVDPSEAASRRASRLAAIRTDDETDWDGATAS